MMKNEYLKSKSTSTFKDTFSTSLVSSKWEHDSTTINFKSVNEKERQMREIIRKGLVVKKNLMINVHSSFMQETYNAHCVRDAKFSSPLNRLNKHSSSVSKNHKKNEILDSASRFFTNKINKNNKILIEKAFYSSNEPNNISKIKIPKINGCVPNETPSQFAKISKEISKFQYKINLNKEKAEREKEKSQNQIDELRECISSVNNVRGFLKNQFIEELDIFLKHLLITKDREKQELNDLLEKKVKLEANIKQIEYKSNKLRDCLNQYKEYRNFMICVKERKLYSELISLIKKDKLNEQENNIYLKRMKSRIFQQDPNNLLKNIKKVEDKDLMEIFFMIKYSDNYNIYSSKFEMLDEYKEIEANNLVLLEEYNWNYVNINKMDNDYIINVKLRNEENFIDSKIAEKEKFLFDLRNLNKDWNRRSLSKSSGFDNAIINPYNKRKNFNQLKTIKIKEIYKVCLDFVPSDFLVETRKRKSLNKPSEEIDINFQYIKIIENVLLYILKRYNNHSKERYNELKEIEKVLEAQKKEKYAKDQKQEDKLKQERIRKKILERLDKDYILPKRRVCTRYRPKDLNKGIVNKTESKMDEFKQLITYDSDF